MTHYLHSSSDCFVNSPHPEYQVELSETGGPYCKIPIPTETRVQKEESGREQVVKFLEDVAPTRRSAVTHHTVPSMPGFLITVFLCYFFSKDTFPWDLYLLPFCSKRRLKFTKNTSNASPRQGWC